MGIKTILVSFCLFLSSSAESSTFCNIPGECYNATLVGVAEAESLEKCQTECIDTNNCYWFSYDYQIDLCELFMDCPTIEDDDSSSSVTFEVSCNLFQCNLPGICLVSAFF